MLNIFSLGWTAEYCTGCQQAGSYFEIDFRSISRISALRLKTDDHFDRFITENCLTKCGLRGLPILKGCFSPVCSHATEVELDIPPPPPPPATWKHGNLLLKVRTDL